MGDTTVEGPDDAAEGATRALAVPEEQFRSVVAAAADAVVLVAGDGSLSYISPQAGRVVGSDAARAARRSGVRWIHPDDRADAAAVYAEAFASAPGEQLTVTHRVASESDEDVWIEARIVNQIGVAGVDALVVNARDVTARVMAEDRLRRRLDAEDLLARMASRFADVRTDELEEALQQTLAAIGEFCGADRAWIFQLDRDRATIDNTHEWCAPDVSAEMEGLRGVPVGAVPVFAGWMGEEGPLLVPSVEEMPDEQSAERDMLRRQGIKSLAAYGMFVRGELRGLVGLDAVRRERAFPEPDLWVLHSAANVFAAALRRCAAEEALASSEERFRAMIHHATDGVRVLDSQLRTLYASPAVEAITGYSGDELADPEARLGRVHPEDQAAIERARTETLAGPGVPVRCTYRCRHRDGHWIDLEEVMTNLLEEPAVGGVVANMRDITAERRHEAELLAQARRDPLTDLPNRRLLDELIDAAIARIDRTGAQLALLYLDLDRFKLVNDSFGHHAGDDLLVDAARRLTSSVRGGDVVARLSGDEFVVLCEPVENESEALAIADRILAAFREPFSIGTHTIYSTASVGVVLSRHGDRHRASLLRDADAAMYSAKAAGRNRAAVFSGTLVTMARERLEVEVGLREAVPEKQLRLRYQPIVALPEARVIGAEALLRWDHPERGILTPDAFLDVAEETGMIVPIGEWVVAEACRQLARWRARGLASSLDMHVNVSVRQLVEGGIAQAVQDALDATGVDPRQLCVEITESALLAGDEATRELSAVRASGVRLALDDFGTGHSSLSYLRHLDLDVLKIDRSFVDGAGTDEHDTAIVTAIVKLAESLGLSTVGEGVENQIQAVALAELGCEQAQGFMWWPALDADELAALLPGAAEPTGAHQ